MGRDPADPFAEQLDELKARFPGWQVWAVPRLLTEMRGGGGGTGARVDAMLAAR